MYALVQKWTDQGISADFYRKVIGDDHIESIELIANYLQRVKLGLKTKYYMNQKTSNGMKQVAEMPNFAAMAVAKDAECESCTL